MALIYLDNAATTLHKPPEVGEAVLRALGSVGNAARGAHGSALDASRTVYDLRCAVAHLFHCPRPDHVAFTLNSTMALNIAILGAIPDGAAAQAERAFANVLAILAAAGLGPESVVKTTVFLADLADFAAVNEVYSRMFSAPFPARSCVQAAALPRGARLEVEAIAVRPS